MKLADIQVGRTYIGDNGVCRTVTSKVVRNRKSYISLKEEPCRWGVRLHKFAKWAKSEVKDGD